MEGKFDPKVLHARAESWGNVFGLRKVIHSCAHEIERLREKQSWKPIETAPHDKKVLTTDGKWMAVATCPSEDEGGSIYGWSISHYAVCQEWGWEPTHWMPLPTPPQST